MFSFASIGRMVLRKRSLFVWGQIITLLAALISIPIPLMLPLMVDEVVLVKGGAVVDSIDALFGSGEAWYYVAIVALVVIAMRFIYFLLGVIQTKIFTLISKEVTFRMRRSMLGHLRTAAMTEYERLGSGTIGAHLVTDVATLDNFIANGASKFIAAVLSLLGVGIVMIIIHPLLGLLILVLQPLVMLVTKRISKSVGVLKKEENRAIEEFQQEVGEVLELFGQIKASNKERYFFNRAIAKARHVQRTSNAFGYKSVAAERFSYTLFLSFFELFRAAGLLMVIYSDLSIGMMFAMFGYIWFIMTPVQEILSLQYSYASARAALGRINAVMQLVQEPRGTQAIEGEGVTIGLEHVGFSYDGASMILEDISLSITQGQKVAIIGASGSGKTTLAQIIAGFYPKSQGTLTYNATPIESLSRASIRSRVFVVLQMPILFNDTLRFNVTMGAPHSDEAIMNALAMAQMDATVRAMPNALETIVGRHGIRLSGGQRQRLAIARMILADPDVVIFDESTSALDVHTEAKLFGALQDLLRPKTLITIAHRHSTVQNAQMVYVLESGRIVEQGSPQALAQREGHFATFLAQERHA
ncbi:MAG: ABC transporter ATP-binding protein [Sulfuricurvum sp. PC08-66]|nr:MAG: ABC transporter ATP-binding protein [Sulfuricurvum sp. PC08-66]